MLKGGARCPLKGAAGCTLKGGAGCTLKSGARCTLKGGARCTLKGAVLLHCWMCRAEHRQIKPSEPSPYFVEASLYLKRM